MYKLFLAGLAFLWSFSAPTPLQAATEEEATERQRTRATTVVPLDTTPPWLKPTTGAPLFDDEDDTELPTHSATMLLLDDEDDTTSTELVPLATTAPFDDAGEEQQEDEERAPDYVLPPFDDAEEEQEDKELPADYVPPHAATMADDAEEEEDVPPHAATMADDAEEEEEQEDEERAPDYVPPFDTLPPFDEAEEEQQQEQDIAPDHHVEAPTVMDSAPPVNPTQARFDALSDTLKDAATMHIPGLSNLNGTYVQHMLNALENVEDTMEPWACWIMSKLGNHLDSSSEDASQAAAQLFTAALARAQAQENAGVGIGDEQDIFMSLETEGNLWTADAFNAYVANTPLLTDDELKGWQDALNVLAGKKQQLLIDLVLAHTSFTQGEQQPFQNNEEVADMNDDEVNPWGNLTEQLVNMPYGTVLDLTNRMAPVLRQFRKNPALIEELLDVAGFWAAHPDGEGLNVNPGSADDLLHQFVQQGPAAWGDNPADALRTILGYVAEEEAPQPDEPAVNAAGGWFGWVPQWARFWA